MINWSAGEALRRHQQAAMNDRPNPNDFRRWLENTYLASSAYLDPLGHYAEAWKPEKKEKEKHNCINCGAPHEPEQCSYCLTRS